MTSLMFFIQRVIDGTTARLGPIIARMFGVSFIFIGLFIILVGLFVLLLNPLGIMSLVAILIIGLGIFCIYYGVKLIVSSRAGITAK
jgi:drug/metabolite transporter (DMT)-like permease